MTEHTSVSHLDDLELAAGREVPAAARVVLAVNDWGGTIDLSRANYDALMTALGPFMSAARPIEIDLITADVAATVPAGEVRAWARRAGVEIGGRGKIPAHVYTAYRQAMTVQHPTVHRA